MTTTMRLWKTQRLWHILCDVAECVCQPLTDLSHCPVFIQTPGAHELGAIGLGTWCPLLLPVWFLVCSNPATQGERKVTLALTHHGTSGEIREPCELPGLMKTGSVEGALCVYWEWSWCCCGDLMKGEKRDVKLIKENEPRATLH